MDGQLPSTLNSRNFKPPYSLLQPAKHRRVLRGNSNASSAVKSVHRWLYAVSPMLNLELVIPTDLHSADAHSW